MDGVAIQAVSRDKNSSSLDRVLGADLLTLVIVWRRTRHVIEGVFDAWTRLILTATSSLH